VAAGEAVYLVLRTRRKELGLTQARLAADVGVSQPAISKFEAGRPGALSREHVEAIARRLGLDLGEIERSSRGGEVAIERFFYCPNAYCPSNVPFVVGGELCFFPRSVRSAAAVVRCAWCGDVMSGQCGHCGADVVVSGAFCAAPGCGRPLVAAVGVVEDGCEPAQWARQRRAEIAELIRLIEPEVRPSMGGREPSR